MTAFGFSRPVANMLPGTMLVMVVWLVGRETFSDTVLMTELGWRVWSGVWLRLSTTNPTDHRVAVALMVMGALLIFAALGSHTVLARFRRRRFPKGIAQIAASVPASGQGGRYGA